MLEGRIWRRLARIANYLFKFYYIILTWLVLNPFSVSWFKALPAITLSVRVLKCRTQWTDKTVLPSLYFYIFHIFHDLCDAVWLTFSASGTKCLPNGQSKISSRHKIKDGFIWIFIKTTVTDQKCIFTMYVYLLFFKTLFIPLCSCLFIQTYSLIGSLRWGSSKHTAESRFPTFVKFRSNSWLFVHKRKVAFNEGFWKMFNISVVG